MFDSYLSTSLTSQQQIWYFVLLPFVPSGFLSTDFEFSSGHFEQVVKIFLFKFLFPFEKSFRCLEKDEKQLCGKEKHSLVGLWNSCSNSNVLRMHLQFVVLVFSKYLGSSYTSNLPQVRLHLTQFLVNSWVLLQNKVIHYVVKGCSPKTHNKARTEKIQVPQMIKCQ